MSGLPSNETVSSLERQGRIVFLKVVAADSYMTTSY